MAAIKFKDEDDPDPSMSIDKQVYETIVLAERKIDAQKLIYNNMQSLGLELKPTRHLR